MNRTLPATLLVIGTFLVAGLPPAEANHGTTVSKTYLLAGENTFLNSCSSNSGIGGVRFCGVDNPHPARVQVTIRDSTGLLAGGSLCFPTNTVGCFPDVFCGTATFDVTPGIGEVWVTVGPVRGLTAGCIAPGSVSGTVTLQWSAT